MLTHEMLSFVSGLAASLALLGVTACTGRDSSAERRLDDGGVVGCGSSCSGTCTPEASCLIMLASGQNTTHRVAVDATSVYWTIGFRVTGLGGERAIMKVSTGGGTPTALVSDLVAPGHLAVDSANVYFTDYGGAPDAGRVMLIPVDGGSPATLAGGGNPSAITVDSSSVYWIGGLVTEGGVMKLLKRGGTPVVIGRGLQLTELAIDAGSIYWTQGKASDTSGGTLGLVVKASLDGSATTTLASEQDQPNGITVDGTSVYWTAGTFHLVDDGVVMKAPLGGGSPETLASDQSRPNCIAVDGANVYWTNLGNGTVMKIPIEGGTPTTLASGQHGPGGIAVDSTSVYWTTYGENGNDGTVMKLTPK